jgi:hypothetical protein
MSDIERKDWGPGGEHRGPTAVTVHGGPRNEPPSPDSILKEMQTGDGRPSLATQRALAEHNATNIVPAKREREPETGRYVTKTHPDWNFGRHGREIVPVSGHDGLPLALVRDMHASAEGYDTQLAMMQESAQRILADMPANFAAHFDTLSPSIQAKCLQTLRTNPGADVYRLAALVQPTLTLSEMAEAQTWIRGLK